MHIQLRHVIEQGDVYFVAFPKWKTGTWEADAKGPSDFWHKTSVLKVVEGTDGYGRTNVRRIDKIPLGSRALVLRNPGEGQEAKDVAEMFNRDDPTLEVLCLVTDAETDKSFVAVVGCTELWPHDPREDYI